MNIIITGVAGFLGSRFAKWVQHYQAGWNIIGFDDLSCGYPENVPEGVRLVNLDISNRGALEDAMLSIGGETEYVFHFAAYAAEGLSPFIRRFNYTNNLLATAEVVNFCIKRSVKRLVFTSSMAVYGGHHKAPFQERIECKPIDPYGIAKLACEQDIECAASMHGLDYCIIRPHNLYGAGQSIWQKYRNVIGHWMSRALEGKPLLVYGPGHQQRAFSWIEDCLPCLWQAAVAPGASQRVINLGGAWPVTINKAAEIVAQVTGGQIQHAPPRYEVKDAWCTTDRSQAVLGYRETVDLKTGVEKMWAWAQEAWYKHPERRGTYKVADLEIEQGLYPYWK